mgnify:CR=1 FL=1|tara:strand:- start:425 stop:745 length:321 start_codon:yes stop_codon:yes gene_type:complete
MGKITKGDITSGEYTRDQKDIFDFPVVKSPKNMKRSDSIPVGQERMPKVPTDEKRKDFLPVDKMPKDKKRKDFLLENRLKDAIERSNLLEERKSGAGYSGTEDYKQ